MNSIYVAGQRKGRKYQSDLEKRRGQIWTTPAPVSTVFTPTIRTPLLQWWQMVRNALVCLFFSVSLSLFATLCLFVSHLASLCLFLYLALSHFVSVCLFASENQDPIVTMMTNDMNTLSLLLYLYLSHTLYLSIYLSLSHSLSHTQFRIYVWK